MKFPEDNILKKYDKGKKSERICYNHSQRLLGSVPTLEIKYKH